MHYRQLSCLLLFCLVDVSASRADLITLQFNNSNAVDGTIDGSSEVFQTSVQTALDASFRFQLEVVSPLAGLVDASSALGHTGGTATGAGADFDASGEDVSLALTLVDFNATGSSTAADIQFSARLLTFDAASSSSDSGSLVSLNGSPVSLTWTDINGASDFSGHAPADSGIDLQLANGGAPVSSFRHNWAGGSWRIDNLTVEYSHVNAIPEAHALLLLLGVGGLVALQSRRRRV
ncbi:MAG: hypothetical protein KDA45_08070 [Planctomycetales bacterium]|nr:hypothetical protein [Planctomycetales bacterium]